MVATIKDMNLGTREKPDFITTKVMICFIRHDSDRGDGPWYTACPTEGCNKKVRLTHLLSKISHAERILS